MAARRRRMRSCGMLKRQAKKVAAAARRKGKSARLVYRVGPGPGGGYCVVTSPKKRKTKR